MERLACEDRNAESPERANNVRRKRTQEILNAAEVEFAKSGFEGASVQAIADRAGLQKRQVLYFFQSKDNLYRAAIDRIFAEWRSQDLDEWQGEPAQIIADYVDHLFAMIREKPHRSRLVIAEMMRGGEIGIPVMMDRDSRGGMARITARLRGWMDQGRMRRTDPLQFIFMLWSFQHFYVAFEPEVAFFLGREEMAAEDWDRLRDHVRSVALSYFPDGA